MASIVTLWICLSAVYLKYILVALASCTIVSEFVLI